MIITSLVTWHGLTRKGRLSREAPLKSSSWRSVPVMSRITLDLWIKMSTRKIMRRNYNKNQITCPLATRVPVNAGPGDPEETFLVLSAPCCKHFEQYRDHSFDHKSIWPPPGAGLGGKFQGLVRGSGLEPGAPEKNTNIWCTYREQK